MVRVNVDLDVDFDPLPEHVPDVLHIRGVKALFEGIAEALLEQYGDVGFTLNGAGISIERYDKNGRDDTLLICFHLQDEDLAKRIIARIGEKARGR